MSFFASFMKAIHLLWVIMEKPKRDSNSVRCYAADIKWENIHFNQKRLLFA